MTAALASSGLRALRRGLLGLLGILAFVASASATLASSDQLSPPAYVVATAQPAEPTDAGDGPGKSDAGLTHVAQHLNGEPRTAPHRTVQERRFTLVETAVPTSARRLRSSLLPPPTEPPRT